MMISHDARSRLWRIALAALSAALMLHMGRCQCGRTPEREGIRAEQKIALLAGQPEEFAAYTRSLPRAAGAAQRALVVGGMVGDLPGVSDALDSLRSAPLESGRLTIVPRANMAAIRAERRSVGEALNDAFGPEASPAQRTLVTTLQELADTCDVLIVVTDMADDVGNSLLYSPDAPVATVSIAQQITEAINHALERAGERTGIYFDEFYALRSTHPTSFISWAAEREHLALELALFGGREPDLPREYQMHLARIATTVALVELGVLSRDALDEVLAAAAAPHRGVKVAQASVVNERPQAEPEVSFPDRPGLRYLINGAPKVHVPGELWGFPATGTLRIVGLSGGVFDGVTVDVVGLGDENDVGKTLSLDRLPASPAGTLRAVEVRYLRGTSVLWKEPALVGREPTQSMVLQDTLGTNPWVAGFPAPESWLYLSTDRLPDRITACAPCELPATLRLTKGEHFAVVGRNQTLRNYHLDVEGVRVGELFVTKWRDTGNTHLVDITEINDRFGLSPGIIVEMRYATSENFLHANVYRSMNRCLLKQEVAEALARVQRSLQARGLGLKVLDCYRPHPVQFRMWEIMPQAGYVAPPEQGSNHNRGAAVDLTLVDGRGRELEMPTEFDNFTERAWQEATQGLSETQIRNKRTLRESMTAQGFSTIRKEWWHYNGPNHQRYTRNLSVPLGTGYERTPFPPAWSSVRLVAR